LYLLIPMLWFLKNFTRLNNWLRSNGFTVEEISYAGGLLRCSTAFNQRLILVYIHRVLY
jgi:hypothetical protein